MIKTESKQFNFAKKNKNYHFVSFFFFIYKYEYLIYRFDLLRSLKYLYNYYYYTQQTYNFIWTQHVKFSSKYFDFYYLLFVNKRITNCGKFSFLAPKTYFFSPPPNHTYSFCNTPIIYIYKRRSPNWLTTTLF